VGLLRRHPLCLGRRDSARFVRASAKARDPPRMAPNSFQRRFALLGDFMGRMPNSTPGRARLISRPPYNGPVLSFNLPCCVQDQAYTRVQKPGPPLWRSALAENRHVFCQFSPGYIVAPMQLASALAAYIDHSYGSRPNWHPNQPPPDQHDENFQSAGRIGITVARDCLPNLQPPNPGTMFR